VFGMIHRIGILYEHEENRPLTYLRLFSSLHEIGVFKASKSYIIKEKSRRSAESSLAKLQAFLEEEYAYTDYQTMPFELFSGAYPFWQYKEFYADVLADYLFTLIARDEAYDFITKTSKKIEYLQKKIDQVRPNFRKSLYPEKIEI
jgi:hypothetical protein